MPCGNGISSRTWKAVKRSRPRPRSPSTSPSQPTESAWPCFPKWKFAPKIFSPKNNGRLESHLRSRRPGSPPPELLICEIKRAAEFCKWHYRATRSPQSAISAKVLQIQLFDDPEGKFAPPSPSEVGGCPCRWKKPAASQVKAT